MTAVPDADGVFDPIERLADEIRAAVGQRQYALALMSTMALVDICGALDAQNGRSEGKRFRAWFEANVAGATARLEAADAWALRCGLLHQGRMRGAGYDHVLFSLPGGSSMHGNIFDIGGKKALNLDLRFFVDDVVSAAERWWSKNKAVEPVATNALHLARVRTNGLSPFIIGAALIG